MTQDFEALGDQHFVQTAEFPQCQANLPFKNHELTAFATGVCTKVLSYCFQLPGAALVTTENINIKNKKQLEALLRGAKLPTFPNNPWI